MSENNGVNQTIYRVLYGDVDQMGVVYYGNYFRLFELGRGEYIRERGVTYRDIEGQGVMLPVAEAHCRYWDSAHYDDLLLIETRITEVRRASVRFAYEIFRDGTREERLIDGWTIHACLSTDRHIVRFPDYLQSILQPVEE